MKAATRKKEWGKRRGGCCRGAVCMPKEESERKGCRMFHLGALRVELASVPFLSVANA